MSIRRLVREVHRRSLWQVLGIYLGTSWVVLQVAENVTESAGLPDWVPSFALVLLIIGLPIVLGTAFVQEGGAEANPGEGGAAGNPTAPGRPPGAAEPGSDPAPGGPEAGSAAGPEGAGGEGRPLHRRLFTWRYALLGGVLAFTLLGVVTAGYMTMRVTGVGPVGSLVAKGLLDERSRILLADFDARDPELARAATEALRVDLSQSEVIRLVEPAAVAEALARMHRPADAPLDAALAREIGIREGIPAVLAGEIASVGGGHVLTARLVASASGELLASHRETAADSTAILGALDRLSHRLRERIGESYTALRASQPLERVTTGSLEALRKYSQALRAIDAGNVDVGIALLEEAVEIDTAFAMAWRKLGTELRNRRESRARQIEALETAYRHRDRLATRERYLTTATYHESVEGDHQAAISAYQRLLELNPDDSWALNNLGVIYGEMREPAREEEMMERAVRADSGNLISIRNAAMSEMIQGKLEEAEATLAEARRRFPEDAQTEFAAVGLLVLRERWDEAEAALRAIRERTAGSLYWQARTAAALGELAATRGRLAEAARWWAESAAAERERGSPVAPYEEALALGWLDIETRGAPERALRRLDALREAEPLSGMPAPDRPYVGLALQYAVAGRPERAAALLEEFRAEVDPRFRREAEEQEHRVEAAIAAAEGRHEEALRALRLSDRGRCLLCPLPGLAHSFEAAGARDSAIAYLERYVATPVPNRLWADASLRGPTFERLARLYEEAGDAAQAAGWYAKLAELWEGADPELQPRVEEARRKARELGAASG